MNNIVISGIVKNQPVYSHTVYGEKFYSFFLETERISGAADIVNCIISESFVGLAEVNSFIEVSGTTRTRNDKNRRLDITVFVMELREFINQVDYVELEGYICKKPVYRETPLGRYICDFMIACDRGKFNKTDYIPCIAWGRFAKRISLLEVGEKLKIIGRLQSREYEKRLADGTKEIRTAYELSVFKFEVLEVSDKCKQK